MGWPCQGDMVLSVDVLWLCHGLEGGKGGSTLVNHMHRLRLSSWWTRALLDHYLLGLYFRYELELPLFTQFHLLPIEQLKQVKSLILPLLYELTLGWERYKTWHFGPNSLLPPSCMFLTLVEKQQEEFLTGWKTVLNSKTPFWVWTASCRALEGNKTRWFKSNQWQNSGI